MRAIMSAITNQVDEQRRRAFVAHVVAGSSPTKAATLAGYGSEGRNGPRMLAEKSIQDAIRSHLLGRISGELAPKAVEILAGILDDPTATPKIRLDAARAILDRAGYIAPKAQDADRAGEKALHELTREELLARRATLESELAERAKPVVIEHVDPLAD